MKRLLQINIVANSLSTGRIVEQIGLQAMQNGMKSFIAYGRGAMHSQSNLIKIGNWTDCFLHGISSRIFDNHGLCSKRATKDFLAQIESIKPDIIHLHNIHGYYLNYPILFKYLAEKNIPVVWTLHDCWAFTGHCAYYDFCACDRWKTQCFDCPQKRTYPASYLFDRSEKNYIDKKYYFTLPENMVIVPVSHWLEREVKNSFLQKYCCQVISNGIDTDVFHPYNQNEMKNKFGWKNKYILLGVASTWSPRKGLRDFIKLSAILPEDYLLVLVGLSEKQIKMLPSNIIGFTKTESAEELAQIYSAADVFINPTWEDNYPTTNLESLACGTPVITYDTGGSPEAISNGSGFIVDKGNINAVFASAQKIISNGKSSYTDICREYALSKYRKHDKYEEYIDLYKKLLINDVK